MGVVDGEVKIRPNVTPKYIECRLLMKDSNILEHLLSTSAESREREMVFARKHAVNTIEANKEIILKTLC